MGVRERESDAQIGRVWLTPSCRSWWLGRFALTEPVAELHTSMSLLNIARQVHTLVAGNGALTPQLAANIGHAVTSHVTFRDALLTVGFGNPEQQAVID